MKWWQRRACVRVCVCGGGGGGGVGSQMFATFLSDNVCKSQSTSFGQGGIWLYGNIYAI